MEGVEDHHLRCEVEEEQLALLKGWQSTVLKISVTINNKLDANKGVPIGGGGGGAGILALGGGRSITQRRRGPTTPSLTTTP